MGLIRKTFKAGLLVAVIGGSIVVYEHKDEVSDFVMREDDGVPSDPSFADGLKENTTHFPETAETPPAIGPVAQTTTIPVGADLREVTVFISGADCRFIDDATGEEVHSFMEGEVLNLSTNQNGAGFVGVDGDNFANEYTLAVKLTGTKAPVELKFGTSIAAQCQDATDYAKLTQEPHEATTDIGKATIPVTEPYSKALFNGDTYNSEAFKNTDIVEQIQLGAIELP